MKRKVSESIHVRLSPDDKRAVEKVAEEYGMSVAAFIRVAIKDELRKLGFDVPPAPLQSDKDNMKGGRISEGRKAIVA